MFNFNTKLFKSLSLILTAIAGILTIAPAPPSQAAETNLKVQFTPTQKVNTPVATVQPGDRTTTDLNARRSRRGRGRGRGTSAPCPACGMG